MVNTQLTADLQTKRLVLGRPSPDDLDELFAIESDPRVWTHYPSGRHTDPSQTLAAIERSVEGWRTHGLGMWTVRLTGCPAVIGYGGCFAHGDSWNLGYRLAAEVHGRGYATELATAALQQALAIDPLRPIIARLLEHNTASGRVAIKLGMELVFRGRDHGNPDPSAVRLIYCDRPLTPAQLESIVAETRRHDNPRRVA